MQETERGENVQKENCRFFRDFRPVLGKTEWKREELEQIERNGWRMEENGTNGTHLA